MAKTTTSTESKIDILLVDDREDNLLTLEAVLTAPAYHLIKVTSGDQALRYLLDHDPALILMDVQMPDLDGYETASLIKSSQRTREIPIIFVTALNLDERYVHKAYDHGAVDYAYKPFDTHILRSKVAVFADLARKTRRLVDTERLLREADSKERGRQIAQLELKSLKRERAEQRKYRELVEGIGHGIVWAMGSDTKKTTFVSPSAEKILGYPLGSWLSESDFFVNHFFAPDRTLFTTALASLHRDGEEVEFDHRFMTKDGTLIWLHTGIRLAKSIERGEIELRALSIDITKIKEAENALRRNKARSDFLAASSALLAESLDTERTFAEFSRLAVPRLADWQSVDLIDGAGELRTVSMSHADLALDEKIRIFGLRFPIENVLSTGRLEIQRFVTPDYLNRIFPDPKARELIEEVSPVSLMIVPVHMRGACVGALTFVSTTAGNDYSDADLIMAEDLGRRAGMALENASLYDQAQAAIRVRDEFLSIASHELKTPLTPLKLQTQSLRRALTSGKLQTMDMGKIEKMLDSSDRQISRISKLIDDLLDISRISSGKMRLTIEDFVLRELIEDIVDRFSEEAKIAKCDIKLFCPKEIEVRWDRFRMEQVIVNLLTNAFKYGAGAEIQIKAQQKEGVVTLEVVDHGIGIQESDQARVFGRFERAVSGSHFGGLGLGLYIVTQILEAHHGKIGLKSEVGKGSTFFVTLRAELTDEEITGPGRTDQTETTHPAGVRRSSPQVTPAQSAH